VVEVLVLLILDLVVRGLQWPGSFPVAFFATSPLSSQF